MEIFFLETISRLDKDLLLSALETLNSNSFEGADRTCVFEAKDFKENPDIEDLWHYFHAERIVQIKKNDDYFLGIRANTFCVEYGYSENLVNKLLIVTANYKGDRSHVIVRLNEEVE